MVAVRTLTSAGAADGIGSCTRSASSAEAPRTIATATTKMGVIKRIHLICIASSHWRRAETASCCRAGSGGSGRFSPAPLSPDKDWRAVLLKRADIFLAIFASQQTGKLRLQRRHRQLLTLAARAMRRRKAGTHSKRSGGGDLFREFGGAVELLTGSGHFLHEP